MTGRRRVGVPVRAITPSDCVFILVAEVPGISCGLILCVPAVNAYTLPFVGDAFCFRETLWFSWQVASQLSHNVRCKPAFTLDITVAYCTVSSSELADGESKSRINAAKPNAAAKAVKHRRAATFCMAEE